MELKEVLEKAKGDMAATTGLKPVSVVQVSKDKEGWHVRVEILELSRIPPATDVLGEYQVLLGEDGTMLGFERRRTRLRGDSASD